MRLLSFRCKDLKLFEIMSVLLLFNAEISDFPWHTWYLTKKKIMVQNFWSQRICLFWCLSHTIFYVAVTGFKLAAFQSQTGLLQPIFKQILMYSVMVHNQIKVKGDNLWTTKLMNNQKAYYPVNGHDSGLLMQINILSRPLFLTNTDFTLSGLHATSSKLFSMGW